MREHTKFVKSKTKKAKKSKEMLCKIEKIDEFQKYFHIRVNSSYYTIVSTLEGCHPNSEIGYFMNGLSCSKEVDLEKEVSKLIDKVQNMSGEDIDLSNFPHRKNGKHYDEYKDQAIFIRALCGDEKYKDQYDVIKKHLGIDDNSCLRFVASEFTLYSQEDEKNEAICKLNKENGGKKKKRIVDVLGVCDNTLYFFELKKDGDPYNDVFNQIDDYKKYYSIRKDEMKAILEQYPLFSTSFEKERFVIVTGHGDKVNDNKINSIFNHKNNLRDNGDPTVEKKDIIAF
jgi:hypothetical protein